MNSTRRSRQAAERSNPELAAKLATAKQLGSAAYAADRKRVPAHDAQLMPLFSGVTTAGVIMLLDAWTHAWDVANIAAPVEA